jgi:hypothetical protein
MGKLHWEGIVDQEFTRVQKLVHLAMRQDMVDEATIKTQLVRMGRRAYEDELTLMAASLGCPGRRGHLRNGPMLSELSEMYEGHAASIVNTYNYYLAMEIQRIREEYRAGNRHYYAKRLVEWDKGYWEWKRGQVAQVTEGSARSLAQVHFHEMNKIDGFMVLRPVEAVCPVCQGWVARGLVPIGEALKYPPPYHVGCPHSWVLVPAKVDQATCELLWMGE